MASRTLVLPWPLSPHSTLKRGCGSIKTSARLRNWRASRAWMRTGGPARGGRRRGRSDAHRHDDADVAAALGALGGAHQPRVELAVELELDLVAFHLAEELDEVLGVEADRERRAVVADVEALVRLAQVRVVARHLELALVDAELDAPGLVRRHDRDALERLERRQPRRDDDLLVLLRDDLVVGRELGVDQLDRQRRVRDAHEEVPV